MLMKSSFETGDELAAEDATEYVDGQEEWVARIDPARAVGRETSGGNDTVDMRMSEQVLTPGMEHGEETDLGSEMLGIEGNLQKSFRTS
jgi:hypothetical protein